MVSAICAKIAYARNVKLKNTRALDYILLDTDLNIQFIIVTKRNNIDSSNQGVAV